MISNSRSIFILSMCHVVIWGIVLIPSVLHAQCVFPSDMRYLDNGVIRIGIDLNRGGSITYLSKSEDSLNVVNSYDLGREIQQSYYSGPEPFGNSHPAFPNWPWNPIGAGDVYCNPAKTVATRIIIQPNNQKTLYVKTIPKQWALNNVPGDCIFETWITLNGNSAQIRCRLLNQRKDKTQNPAYYQEVPAVYTIGKLFRLFSYTGPLPFQNRPTRKIALTNTTKDIIATEYWAALVDKTGWGLGVVHSSTMLFAGAFFGQPGIGGPSDNDTGYITPFLLDIIDHNIRYEYTYSLVLGTLTDIRAFAVSHRPDTKPNYLFQKDRQHFNYVNLSDSGFPINGKLRLKLEQDDPNMIGPEQFWFAEDVPKIFIRASFNTKNNQSEIFWASPGKDFSANRRIGFQIIPDGQMRTYEVDMASHPFYQGTISRLRFDPIASVSAGDSADIVFISWKQNP